MLQNNAGDDLHQAADGSFRFATALPGGAAYAVTVKAQPSSPAQTCTVNNGSGTIASAEVDNVKVICATNSYLVGGTVSGLGGSGLLLQNNGADDLAVAADGSFVFAQPVASGAAYAVTVKTQPGAPAQTCSVSRASGTVSASAVSDLTVMCSTRSFTVSGTVSGLVGSGLALRNNAGDDLAVAANGAFSFSVPVASGADYGVTVKTQPSALQVCIARQAFGTVTTGPIASVTVACTVPGIDRFAFTANEGSDTLTRYTVAADGQLSNATSFAAGDTPQHVSVHPEGKSVYVANILGGTVTQYSIDAAGALTRLPEVTANVGSYPLFVGIEPKGRFAYVVGNGAIHRFGIDATGNLVNGATFPGAVGSRKISFDPEGRFAFAPNNGSIGVYLLDQATGDPTLAPASVAQPLLQDIVIEPTGRFAYVDSISGTGGAGTLSAYAINAATGALTLIGSVPTGVTPFSLTVDPTGRFVYVVNRSSNSVSAYAIEPRTGALTAVPGQPFATGNVPDSVTVDRTGRFAYTANQGDNTITFFTIDRATGALGTGVNFPALGNRPQFLALTR
ncbi:lactonase family protein [Variovorax sp. LARHSF232]